MPVHLGVGLGFTFGTKAVALGRGIERKRGDFMPIATVFDSLARATLDDHNSLAFSHNVTPLALSIRRANVDD